jgi:hypothetical protein
MTVDDVIDEARDREALRLARWLSQFWGMSYYVRHIRAEVAKRRKGKGPFTLKDAGHGD